MSHICIYLALGFLFTQFVLEESIPRQVNKKSGGPQGESSLEFSRRKKGQTFFFPLHSLVLVNYTTQFKLCTRDCSLPEDSFSFLKK